MPDPSTAGRSVPTSPMLSAEAHLDTYLKRRHTEYEELKSKSQFAHKKWQQGDVEIHRLQAERDAALAEVTRLREALEAVPRDREALRARLISQPFARCPSCHLNRGRSQHPRVICDHRWHDIEAGFAEGVDAALAEGSDVLPTGGERSMHSITLTADEKALLDRVDRSARHGEAFTAEQANGLRAIVDRFDFDTIVPHVPGGSEADDACRWCGSRIWWHRTHWLHGRTRDGRVSCCNGQHSAEPRLATDVLPTEG